MHFLQDVYDPHEPPAAARQGLFEDMRLEREGSLRRLRIGWRLTRFERDRLYADWGHDTMGAFVEEARDRGEGPFGWDQAQVYLGLARLPGDLFVGTNFPVKELKALAARQEAGEDLRPHIERLQADRRLPALRSRRDPAGEKPSAIARKALRALRALVALLGVLFGKTDGRESGHGWARDLDELMQGLVRAYAAWRGVAPAELCGERRQRAREAEEAADGAGATAGADEKLTEDGGLASILGGSGEGLAGGGAAGRSESTLASISGGSEEGPAEGAAEAEDWHGPLARAVVAQLLPEEAPRLAAALQVALAGGPPQEVVALVRRVGERMGEAVPALREDLALWLKRAAQRELAERWPYLFNLFSAAQLDGFRRQLHSLLAVELPPALRNVVEEACAYWPLEEEGPAGAAAAVGQVPPALASAERLVRDFLAGPREANAVVMGEAWEQAYGLKHELLPLIRQLEALAAPAG